MVTLPRIAGGFVVVGAFFLVWGAFLPRHVPAIVLYLSGAFLIAIGLYLTWGYFRYVKKQRPADRMPPS